MTLRSSICLAILAVAMAGCGAPPQPKTSPAIETMTQPQPPATQPAQQSSSHRDPLVGPDGEKAVLMGRRVKIILPSGSEQTISPTDLHPPPGDRGLMGISPTALLFLDNGTLLVGMGDGTVTAVDSTGHRKYSIGFHGAISGFAPTKPGHVALTTHRGVLAHLTYDGRMYWEDQITAERLSPPIITRDGRIVTASQRGVFAYFTSGDKSFSHASHLLFRGCDPDDRDCKEEPFPQLSRNGEEIIAGHGLRFRLEGQHPAVPSLEPTFPLTFRKVLSESVVSLMGADNNALLALVTKRKYRSEYDWGEDDKYEVVRIDGNGMKRFKVPDRAARSEAFLEDSQPVQANLFIDGLVSGPNGNPWILARRFSVEKSPSIDALLSRWTGSGQLLEMNGGLIRERNDLFTAFSQHWVSVKVAAAPQGLANLFCFGDESPACAVYSGSAFQLLTPPGKVASVSRIGDRSWILTKEGLAFRNEGQDFAPISTPKETSFKEVAGTSDKDVWADFNQRYALLHFDGTKWTEVTVPTSANGFFVRAADDIWSGRMQWDGKRWSRIHGAPLANVAFSRKQGDVWLGNASGLWHGTAPGPSPALVPSAKYLDLQAIPTPPPLPLGSPATAFQVERTNLTVAGGAPLTTAKNISASSDGVVWIQAGDRVVQIDESGKATTLRGRGRVSFGRWAYPEAKGRGIVLDTDEILRIDGRNVTSENLQFDDHEEVAIHGNPRGSTWVIRRPLGESSWSEFAPHAFVRTGGASSVSARFRPVLRLPSADWCDVAATPDGGAWLAGGLSPGPSGEGLLFHVRGIDSSARYRAPASLLAVTAVSSKEAWAVGAAGTVIHVQDEKPTRFTLASAEWLRAVATSSPSEVWIGGDGGTLLYYDGSAFHPVNHPLGTHAAITGIALAKGIVWVVSPSGILRITKR